MLLSSLVSRILRAFHGSERSEVSHLYHDDNLSAQVAFGARSEATVSIRIHSAFRLSLVLYSDFFFCRTPHTTRLILLTSKKPKLE